MICLHLLPYHVRQLILSYLYAHLNKYLNCSSLVLWIEENFWRKFNNLELVIIRVLSGQKFLKGETEGRLGLMGRLGGPRGRIWEGDVPPPVPNTKSLSIQCIFTSEFSKSHLINTLGVDYDRSVGSEKYSYVKPGKFHEISVNSRGGEHTLLSSNPW